MLSKEDISKMEILKSVIVGNTVMTVRFDLRTEKYFAIVSGNSGGGWKEFDNELDALHWIAVEIGEALNDYILVGDDSEGYVC